MIQVHNIQGGPKMTIFGGSVIFLITIIKTGHIKNIHLHRCKHKTVKLKLTLTLTDTGGAVLTLILGYRRLRNYKLKQKIQI